MELSLGRLHDNVSNLSFVDSSTAALPLLLHVKV